VTNTTTNTTMTTITEIISQPLEAVDIVLLSNGEKIAIWNGAACYHTPDSAEGKVEVGATLVAKTSEIAWNGERFDMYTFA
jgi:phosphoglycerate-specific signal transduction histidine kinase